MGRGRRGTLPIAFGSALLLCAGAAAGETTQTDTEEGAMQLESPGFEDGGPIPEKFTCEGEDVSPELRWSDLPDGAESLVLVVDDPDAPDPANPKMTWVHWVLFDIPTNTNGLLENVQESQLPPGTRQGTNDFERTRYGGPCPPVGRHRYFHKLYALDTTLGLPEGSSKAEVEKAMRGHVLAETHIVGTYEKGR